MGRLIKTPLCNIHVEIIVGDLVSCDELNQRIFKNKRSHCVLYAGGLIQKANSVLKFIQYALDINCVTI